MKSAEANAQARRNASDAARKRAADNPTAIDWDAAIARLRVYLNHRDDAQAQRTPQGRKGTDQ